MEHIPLMNQLRDINREAVSRPAELIRDAVDYYAARVRALAEQIAVNRSDAQIVMLSGPSASGKTTTSHMLAEALSAYGIGTRVVSLDDFYLGRGIAPRLPDGSHDYESVEALNIPLMLRCLLELLEAGRAEFPIFDFTTGAPAPHTKTITVGEHDIVLVEGIHALNPVITSRLPREKILRLYVSVDTPYMDGDREILTAGEIRLARRLLRDYKFRSSDPDNTLDMWRQVCRGEKLYLTPFEREAQVRLNAFHSFEGCIHAASLVRLLHMVNAGSPFYEDVMAMREQLLRFEQLPISLVPKDSLVREFTGGGIYAR